MTDELRSASEEFEKVMTQRARAMRFYQRVKKRCARRYRLSTWDKIFETMQDGRIDEQRPWTVMPHLEVYAYWQSMSKRKGRTYG